MARSCRCAKRLVSNSQSPCHDQGEALCPRNRGRIPVGPQGAGAARTGVCSKNEQDRPVVCNDVAAGLIRPSLPSQDILTKTVAEPGLTTGASGRTPAGIAPDRLACCLLTIWIWEG